MDPLLPGSDSWYVNHPTCILVHLVLFLVMFIISLSDYNQTLYEDETTNRMQESEKLFGEMLNNVFFRETPFIVFFNKVDLFKEKLKTASLAIAYKEYTGSQDYEEAL